MDSFNTLKVGGVAPVKVSPEDAAVFCEMRALADAAPECVELTDWIQPWETYPIGTRAIASSGGWWTKSVHGWKWNTGDTFPTPGADVVGVLLPESDAADGDVGGPGLEGGAE
jgi:hypothetical protein